MRVRVCVCVCVCADRSGSRNDVHGVVCRSVAGEFYERKHRHVDGVYAAVSSQHLRLQLLSDVEPLRRLSRRRILRRKLVYQYELPLSLCVGSLPPNVVYCCFNSVFTYWEHGVELSLLKICDEITII